ncbi:MAG: hypothetical protein COS90_00605 [Deltaproteobacteria bacterium CG07_land_8_20_14_0_80_60_11]|nr:MAG: hypothetical protein COS90_00605 [Deltaproteobacteria bacterium CG07_land_8_20_14_0_80_60_11]
MPEALGLRGKTRGSAEPSEPKNLITSTFFTVKDKVIGVAPLIKGGRLRTGAWSLVTPVRPKIRGQICPLFPPPRPAGLHLDIGFGWV